MSHTASVIVRTFDSAATVARTLQSIRAQTVEAEIVVVDSGSSDATLDIAGGFADRIVRIPTAEFTFGGALNTGAEHAGAPVHVALSSHCVLPRADWIEIATSHILEGGASAAVGADVDGERRPLLEPLLADRDLLMRHRHWGFTNHASAWSAEVWRRHRFDETLAAAEDKEWSWRALADGGHLVVDPRLFVAGDHRRSAGARAYYRRLVKEMRAIEGLRPLEPLSGREALTEWTRATPHDPMVRSSRRFGRTRLIQVAARWRATRGPGP